MFKNYLWVVMIFIVMLISLSAQVYGANISLDMSHVFSTKDHYIDNDRGVLFEKRNDLNCNDDRNRDIVDTLWTKTFGGAGLEFGFSVKQTIDDGYIVVGRKSSYVNGPYDAYLIKTDSSGDTLWTTTYGGDTSSEGGYDIQQTTDGGYIIAGTVYSDDNTDVLLLKTDSSGDTLWSKVFGCTGVDRGQSVQQTTDGGYLIAGCTDSYGAGFYDVWLIKTDVSGDTLWTKTYGGGNSDNAYCVQQTTDNGYIITGYTKSFGAGVRDVWLIKTDSDGNVQWDQTFGGAYHDVGMYVQQTTDGGYIVTGRSLSYCAQGGSDVYLIKTDDIGNTIWSKTFGGTGWDSAAGYCVQQVTDGGYIIAGWLDTWDYIDNNGDVWLIKTNPSGEVLWTKTINGNGNGVYSYDVARSIQQTTDGGYIITGVTGLHDGDQDIWLIKTDEDPAPGSIGGAVSLNGGTGNPNDVQITALPGNFQTNPVNGNYSLVVLEGDFDVTASLEGYISQTFENVHVDLGQTTILNITLDAVDIAINPDSFYFETTGTASDIMNMQNQCTIDLDYQILFDFEDEDEIHYDGENDDNAFGLSEGGTFITAVRFTAEELASYYGSYNLAEINIFIYDDSYSNVTLKVWEGGNYGDPGEEIYSEDITADVFAGEWKNHLLTTSIPLINNNEYWIGYSITHSGGGAPVGVDAGPMVAGKGGWIYYMDQWSEMATVGLDYNLNIRALVSKPWLTCNPISGTIPSNGNVDIDVIADATELDYGDYFTDIIVKILPDCATYIIPVHLNKTLNPPQNLFVTDEGYATWEAPGGGGPQTIQVNPQSIPYYTGTCTSSSFTDDSEVRAHDIEDGWMMFDISAITTDATITEIEFHGFINDNCWPYWQINGVDIDPLIASAGDLYANLQFPQYNDFQESGDLPIDWRVEILGGDANMDMEAALSQGWFCIGINSTDNSNDYYIEFDGWNEANPPYLMVDYETNDRIVGKTRVDLKSKASENRELLGYNVYLDDMNTPIATNIQDLFYQYTDLTSGQTYLAGVSAVYDEGESAIIDFEFTFVLDPPQNLGIVCLEDHAHFTWEAPIADMRDSKRNTKTRKENTRDLTGYNVYLDQVEVATNIPDLEYDFYDLINGEYYDAGVKAVYDEGASELIEINFQYTGTGVENILPLITELTGNYPNPFNPETTISFSTTESSENTELVIYNLKGQKVKTLFNEKLPAGNHQIVWDGKDENGKPVSSGIYFYKMNTKDYTSTKRMILMK